MITEIRDNILTIGVEHKTDGLYIVKLDFSDVVEGCCRYYIDTIAWDIMEDGYSYATPSNLISDWVYDNLEGFGELENSPIEWVKGGDNSAYLEDRNYREALGRKAWKEAVSVINRLKFDGKYLVDIMRDRARSIKSWD